MYRNLLNLIVVSGFSLGLVSCGTSRVSDNVSIEAVQAANKGIVIVSVASLRGKLCDPMVLHLSKKVGEKYHHSSQVRVRSLFGADSPAQFQMKAGIFHITNMVCFTGNRQYWLRKPNEVFGRKRPTRSYGTFAVNSGEVVNIGHLKLAFAIAGFGAFNVTDLPENNKKWLAENKPKLYNRMVTRLLKSRKPPVIRRVKKIN